MTVFDLMRNTLLAAFGVQEKLREFVEDLVKKGEMSESQGAKLVKEWAEMAEKNTSEMGRLISEVVTKTMEKMSIPTRDDMESLNKKIENLSARVKSLEERGKAGE